MGQSFSTFATKPDPQTAGNLPLLGPAPVFRNAKDARLASFGQSPDAQYPDGYLGNITNRRGDKLQSSVVRATQRQYTRGVHKGERINPGDYLWPESMNLMSGLQAQAEGRRWAPPGPGPAPHLVNDGKVGPRGVPTGMDRMHVDVINEQRRAALSYLKPSWR